MSKLKTLRDIEFGRSEKEDRELLRQEAIEWIKEDLINIEKRHDVYGYFIYNKKDIIKDWMKRLNITVEDLE